MGGPRRQEKERGLWGVPKASTRCWYPPSRVRLPAPPGVEKKEGRGHLKDENESTIPP